MKISLLLGQGVNGHYELGLLSGLIPKPIFIDVIGSNRIMNSSLLKSKNVNFMNYFGDRRPNVSIKEKIIRVSKYYFRLIKYVLGTDSKLFHIQWINKFAFFDRTVLIVLYKLLGKNIVYTAHNIDESERDGKKSPIGRFSLQFLYNNVNHIIVHTEKMKSQLIREFNINERKITIIPHGLMNVVPRTDIDRLKAREKLSLAEKEKVLLFFGNIAPYKGLHDLIDALKILDEKHDDYRVIVAGKIKDCKEYWENIQKIISESDLKRKMILRIGYIPDDEIELYFKSADVLLLPYTYIFQSGVIFLSYHFGLPVIATDVGSLKEEIVEGESGFICEPANPFDLAKTIELYFHSDLYLNLEKNREKDRPICGR